MKPVERLKLFMANRLVLLVLGTVSLMILLFLVTGIIVDRNQSPVSGDSEITNLRLLERIPIPEIPSSPPGFSLNRERKTKYSDQDVLEKWERLSDEGVLELEAETMAEIRAMLESAP